MSTTDKYPEEYLHVSTLAWIMVSDECRTFRQQQAAKIGLQSKRHLHPPHLPAHIFWLAHRLLGTLSFGWMDFSGNTHTQSNAVVAQDCLQDALEGEGHQWSGCNVRIRLRLRLPHSFHRLLSSAKAKGGGACMETLAHDTAIMSC